LSFSINGMRCATAFFMARALFTTCGRNILPSPKRSPTTVMPAISGPFDDLEGARILLQRLVEILLDEVDGARDERVGEPLLSRRTLRQERSIDNRFFPPPFTCSASSTRRSVASGNGD
jgi:hypothetical protein